MTVLQPPLLCEGWGGHLLCLSGDSPVLMDHHRPCEYTAQCSILSIGSVLESSSFSLFHSGQVFHELVCPLPQIFFSLTKVFSYQVFFSLFHAPLDVVFHFPVFLRSFRFKSFLSQFSLLLLHRSRISLVTQDFFLLAMFAKDLTGCFNHCCVEGGDQGIQVCVFIVQTSRLS